MSIKTIGIAGAGLMGRLMAHKLLLAGYEVTLFDRDDRCGKNSCGYAAAAMLAPISEADKAPEIVVKLGMASIPLWQQMIEDFDDPIYFQQQGSLFVAHSQDLAELQYFKNHVCQKLSSDDYFNVDADGIAELEPSLAGRFNHGIYLPHEAQLANAEWLVAVEKKIIELGGHWHVNTDVIDCKANRIQIPDQHFEFDLVIDTRGLGAKPDLKDLRGVRGERFKFSAPGVTLNRPIRLMHPRYHLYIVPRPNNEFIIGASEIESEDMSPISVRSSLELLSAIYSIDPAFGEARIVETVVNCRPALPDNKPCILSSDGLIRINGLYRNGYLVSPAVANDAMAVIQRQPLIFPEILNTTDENS